ncbi:MAG: 2'-5' RNA ligase family protein [Nanoarchaeota archaeon]
MKVDAIDLNVVLFPDEKTRQTVIEWSNDLSQKFDTYFVLDGINFNPHITLYQARYPVKNQEEIMKRIESFVKKTHPFTVTMKGFSHHWGFRGFIFADVEVAPQLRTIHDSVVDSLNELREGEIASTVKALTDLTKEQKDAVDKYGYIFAKDTFTLPHITLTRLKDPKQADKALRSLEALSPFSFFARTIAIAPTSEHGTCPQPIKTFYIK